MLLRPPSAWYPAGRLNSKLKKNLASKVTLVEKEGGDVCKEVEGPVSVAHENNGDHESDADSEAGELRGEASKAGKEQYYEKIIKEPENLELNPLMSLFKENDPWAFLADELPS